MKWAVLAFALLTLSASQGAAQNARFTWTREPGAESCADEARIGRQISRLLARGNYPVSDVRHVTGTVSAETNELVAMLTLEERGVFVGVRMLRAPRCDALEEQVVFVAFLLLSSPAPEVDVTAPPPVATQVEAPPDVVADAPPEPLGVEPEAPRVEPEMPTDDRESSALEAITEHGPRGLRAPYFFHVGMLASVSVVSGSWPGMSVGFGHRVGHFGIAIGAAYVPPRSESISPDSSVRKQALLADVRACVVSSALGPITLEGCGAFGVILLASRVRAPWSSALLQTSPYLAPVLAGSVSLTTRAALRLEVSAPVRLVRRAQIFQDSRGVPHLQRDDAMAFTAALSLEVEIGRLR